MLRHNLNTNLKLETNLDPAVILRSEILALPLFQLEAKIKEELVTDKTPKAKTILTWRFSIKTNFKKYNYKYLNQMYIYSI